MAEKRLNARIIHKHETEANWLQSSLIPMKGELIVYDIDDNYSYERIKIGDGVQNVNDLPFYAGNWEDLVGKPFWSKGPTTVEWDGNTDGLAVSSDGTVYRVSDLKPSSTEVIGGKLAFSRGNIEDITSDIVTNHGYIISIYYNTILINTSNGSAYDYNLSVTLPEPGIYFQKNTYNQIVSFSYGNETVHCLNEKYIPDTIARITDIPEQIADDALSSTSTNPVQNKVVNTAISTLNTLIGDTSVSEQISKALLEHTTSHAPSDAEANVQSNWNETSTTSDAYILNKPSIKAGGGTASIIVGDISSNTAEGDYAYAGGRESVASGHSAHAEGYKATASESFSYAQGRMTKATGYASHAEGNEAVAKGYASHAEGMGTIAGSSYQHVQGLYNIEDTTGTYVHIVGNGGGSSLRSNAHTLDKDGNAWFAGDVYIGGTSQDDATKLSPGVMPNLLDNWYFADPVNSQGLTSYLSGTYAIDRWFMRTSQGIVVDGGFQVYNADGISFYGITQALNNPTQYCGKTVTFSAKFTEINTASAIEMKIASSTQVSGVGTVINEIKNITTPGIYSVTATIPSTLPSTTLAVWITCRDADVGASYTIESVKLEFGSVSTLALDSMPNKADQVARCSNYDASGAFLDTLFATQAFVLKYVPKIATITLSAEHWVFNSNAYYQDVVLNCATTTSKVDLQPTYYQLAEWQTDGLAFSTESKKGIVRVWVTDVVPREDITIQVSVQEVLEV